MANTTSQHILPTSANLLGFCLFVVTSLHITNSATTTLLDEFTSCVALLLAFSCVLSFLSIRTQDQRLEERAERLADYLFLAALVGIVVIILLLIFKFIK